MQGTIIHHRHKTQYFVYTLLISADTKNLKDNLYGARAKHDLPAKTEQDWREGADSLERRGINKNKRDRQE
jgi:hypothetical protein